MLDNFWSSFLSDDTLEMEYIHEVEYSDDDAKAEVMERLDWLILRLHKIRDERKSDYDLVDNIRRKVLLGNFSLTTNGVDYLNLIIATLK